MPDGLFGSGFNQPSQEPANPWTDPTSLWQQGGQERAAKAAAEAQASFQGGQVGGGATYGDLSAKASPRVSKWATQINAAAKKYGIPANIIAGVMMVESGGNDKALGAKTKWGQAKGAMQIMPFHFKSGENPYDIALNIDKGASILARNYKKRGNWGQALSDYNGTTGSSKGTYYTNKVMNYVNSWGGIEAKGGNQPVTASGSASRTKLDAAIADAMKQQGKTYVLGAKVDLKNGNPGAFDCSSLVQWAYGRQGISLPRLARQQYTATQRVDKANLQPGDLVFFQGTTGAPGITHVGIYIGNGKMVNAVSQGKGIQVQSINSNYWSSHYAGAGRAPGAGSASPVGSGSQPQQPQPRSGLFGSLGNWFK